MRAIFAVPLTLGLVYRAHSHKSLTPFGIVVAALTATVHAIHPWNLPFVLLIVFFLAGTRATAVKKEVKASLTLSAQGSSGGEGPRTHVQVLANSLVASILSLLHTYQLSQRRQAGANGETTACYSWKGDLLVVGIIANYAAVCADTFSSELGILSRTEPRLITSLSLRKVPRGTNGGVTVWGLVAGLLGSMIIVATSMISLPLCGDHTSAEVAGGGGGQPWSLNEKLIFAGGMTILGALGSLLDSFLGGWLQRSVRDVRTGKIVEGEGGVRVLASGNAPEINQSADLKARLVNGEGANAIENTSSAVDESNSATPARYDPKNKHRKPSFGDNMPTRVVETGWDLLDNNEVNLLMAFSMSVIGMVVASWYWDVPIASIFEA